MFLPFVAAITLVTSPPMDHCADLEAPAAARGLFGWWDAGIDHMRREWLGRLLGQPVSLRYDGLMIERIVWRGDLVALATRRDDLEPREADRLLGHLEAFWLACRRIAGDSPPSDLDALRELQRGVIIVERADTEPGTPTAGIAGSALVPIDRRVVDELVGATRQAHPVLPLGAAAPKAIARAFHFFDHELGPIAEFDSREGAYDAITGAYADLLVAAASESLGWRVPPDDDHCGDEAPAGWRSIIVGIANASGRPDFAARLWRATAESPPASDGASALANLLVALSAASGQDESPRFFPLGLDISDAVRTRVAEALNVQPKPRSR